LTKKEKAILDEAIDLLLDEEQHFHRAISMLFGLLGKKWHVWEAMNDPDFKATRIDDLKPNSVFKMKIKPEWLE